MYFDKFVFNIHNYKIQGRQSVIQGDIYKTVKAYMDRYYEGDFVSLINCFHRLNCFQYKIDNRFLDDFIAPFYKNKSFCRNNCCACNYCDRYIKNLKGYSDMEHLYCQAQSFYKSYNVFLEYDKKEQ